MALRTVFNKIKIHVPNYPDIKEHSKDITSAISIADTPRAHTST